MDTKLLNRISKLLTLGNGSSFDGFDCRAFRYSYQDQQNRICNTEYIVGRESNRVTAVLMYNWLRDKLRADAIIRGGKSSARDAYCLGCVHAIYEKVSAIKATDAWGIVPINEVTQWIKTMHPELMTRAVSICCRDAAAYIDGQKDGANINLNRQFAQQALPCT